MVGALHTLAYSILPPALGASSTSQTRKEAQQSEVASRGHTGMVRKLETRHWSLLPQRPSSLAQFSLPRKKRSLDVCVKTTLFLVIIE